VQCWTLPGQVLVQVLLLPGACPRVPYLARNISKAAKPFHHPSNTCHHNADIGPDLATALPKVAGAMSRPCPPLSTPDWTLPKGPRGFTRACPHLPEPSVRFPNHATAMPDLATALAKVAHRRPHLPAGPCPRPPGPGPGPEDLAQGSGDSPGACPGFAHRRPHLPTGPCPRPPGPGPGPEDLAQGSGDSPGARPEDLPTGPCSRVRTTFCPPLPRPCPRVHAHPPSTLILAPAHAHAQRAYVPSAKC